MHRSAVFLIFLSLKVRAMLSRTLGGVQMRSPTAIVMLNTTVTTVRQTRNIYLWEWRRRSRRSRRRTRTRTRTSSLRMPQTCPVPLNRARRLAGRPPSPVSRAYHTPTLRRTTIPCPL